MTTQAKTNQQNSRLSRRAVIQGSAAAGAAAVVSAAGVAQFRTDASPAAPASTASSLAQNGTSITISGLAEPASLISGAPVTGATTQRIYSFTANGLTKLSYPEFEPIADLAEDWELSDDELTYTFTLRQDVFFQDGEPFTADDVKFTYDLVTDPEWPGALDSYFENIQGAAAHKNGEADEVSGVQVVDDYTVTFTFDQPDAHFLSFAGPRQRILPQHILQDIPPDEIEFSDFARSPIYTGPYQIEQWNPGESISLSAVPDHWSGETGADTFLIRFIPDPSTAIAELQGGAIQFFVVDPDQYPAFVDNPEFTTQEVPGSRFAYLLFDLTLPLFEDDRVRKAISHAIDRDAVIDTLYLGYGEPARSFVSPIATIYNEDAPTFPYDPDQANALLDEAGWEPGDDGIRARDGERLAFELSVRSSELNDALAIQPFLQEVGIEVTINELGAGQATGPFLIGEYEGAVEAWNNFVITPKADLQRYFRTPRPADPNGYENEEANVLFEEAESEFDTEASDEIYREIQAIVGEDAPLVYLWRQTDLLVTHNSLELPEVTSLTELFARVPEWTRS